jgi:transforming growth factor-beta-induced protein
MKQITSIMMILILTFGMIGVYAAEGDIVDVASNIDEFSILVTALAEAELVGALQGEGPFTVFAPTDTAFANLLSELNITAEELLTHPQLSEVLLYHVVSGKVMSSDLADGMMATTLQGETLKVDLSSGVMINMSNVTTADVEATNGVIHVIDKVFVPDSFKLETVENDIVDIALGNEYFSMLVSLLQQADLVETLQGEGPFTVFAPTNKAFEDLLEALDISASELMAQPDLAKVLLYHVVSGKVMSTDLTDGLMAPTVNGKDITFDLSNGVKVNTSNVISADLEATNGVVHVVDSVLVPEDFTLQSTDMNEPLPKTGDIGLIPYFLLGVMGLGGIGLVKKKAK